MISLVFIISSLKGHGGMERVASLLSNILVEQNYSVAIITRDKNDEYDCAFYLDNRVKVVNFSGNLFSFLGAVQDYIKVNKPSFVISHNMGKMTLALSVLSYNKYGSKLVSFEHVANVTSPKYVQFLKRLLYLNVDKVVVLSKEDLLDYTRFHKNVFKVYNPNPYDVDKNIVYNAESKKIISIGRLTHQKGFDLLLEAWSKVEEKYPNWTYEIYGDGEDLLMLENKKKDLGLKRFSFKGFSSNLTEVYTSASFFVLSSRFEGFGMVLIEAHTFGLPTVSFDCPHGPSDIITEGLNGRLVPNGDIDGLADSIELLMNDTALRKEMSKQALASVEVYSNENIINNWNKVFNG